MYDDRNELDVLSAIEGKLEDIAELLREVLYKLPDNTEEVLQVPEEDNG